MKIGICGLNWDIGIPLALTLRDYGRHAVIAYGETGQQEWTRCDPPPEREAQILLEQWGLPITDRIQLFTDYCDLVFACEPDLVGTPFAWLNRARTRIERLPVVVACPLPTPQVMTAWARGLRRLDLGYSPLYIDRSNGISQLSNPDGPIWVSGSEQVHQAVELAWRPVVNTVPVRRVPLGYQIIPAGVSEGPGEGSPLATERLAAPPRDVDNPPPIES